MLTGRRPITTRVYGNREWFGATHPEWVSLPRHFKRNGYLTLRAGKIFHGGIDDTEVWSEGGEPRQFTGAPGGGRGPRESTTAARETRRLEEVSAQDRARAPQSDRWEAVEDGAEGLGDDAVVERTIAYLRRHRDTPQPFFIACGLSKPHSPLVAPRRFFDLYGRATIRLPPDFAPRPTVPPGFPAGAIRLLNADLFVRRDASEAEARDTIRAYRACVSYVDWNVGRVLQELEALGLSDNTIVVFLGDHGYPAPASISARTSAWRPRSAARLRALVSFASVSKLDCLGDRVMARAAASVPSLAADMRAVQPSLSATFTSAPATTRSSAGIASFRLAASIRAVQHEEAHARRRSRHAPPGRGVVPISARSSRRWCKTRATL